MYFLEFHPNLSFKFQNIPTILLLIYAGSMFFFGVLGHLSWKRRKMVGLHRGAPIVGVSLWLFAAMVFHGHWTISVLLPMFLFFGWWLGRDLARRPIQWKPNSVEQGGEAD